MKTKPYMLATAILICGLTFVSTVQAQPGQGRPSGARVPYNPYAQLDLTEKQQAKMKALQEKQRADSRKLFEGLRDGGGDRQAAFAKMRALSEQFAKDMQTILTDAQKKKLADLRAERPARRPGQGGFGGRRNPLAGLDLTEKQQKKLDAARTEMSTQMRALFADRDTPREEQTAKRKKISEAYEATLKKVLTEGQLKKYQEARNARGGRGDGPGRQPGQGGGRGDPYAALDLTEAQQKKVTALSAEQRTEMTKMFQALREGGGFEGMREKMTALRAKYDKKIEALLTDEQKKKFKELRSNRGRRPGGGGRPRPDGKGKPRPKRSDA